MSNLKVNVINKNEASIEEKINAVYVGRGSPLGNPWTHTSSKRASFQVDTREEAIAKYGEWITDRLRYSNSQSRAFNECVRKLVAERELTLMCFCKPLPCHADILAKLMLQAAKEEDQCMLDLFGS